MNSSGPHGAEPGSTLTAIRPPTAPRPEGLLARFPAVGLALFVLGGLLFGPLGFELFGVARSQKALEFLTGYLIELSLSVDNLFVFLLLFSYFKVPPKYQHRVLYWGVLGALVMRVEDLDRSRVSPESEAGQLDDLRWLGLDWDEGPDLDGPHGPYRQSERLHLYQSYAAELMGDGNGASRTSIENWAERDTRRWILGSGPCYSRSDRERPALC